MKMLYPFFSDPKSSGGLGLDKEAYGMICGSAGVAALLLGGILGGFYISRHGLRRSMPLMALSLTLPCIVYPFLALVQPESLGLTGLCIAFDQFGYGFGFTAYTVYMMQYAPVSWHFQRSFRVRSPDISRKSADTQDFLRSCC